MFNRQVVDEDHSVSFYGRISFVRSGLTMISAGPNFSHKVYLSYVTVRIFGILIIKQKH